MYSWHDVAERTEKVYDLVADVAPDDLLDRLERFYLKTCLICHQFLKFSLKFSGIMAAAHGLEKFFVLLLF